ncbi:MAG: flagellar basal body-associated FliL family protein [Gammaproteobacteria bacterium]|nr:flagellar basal body-associated FliL family protein [Gammaproteobacteria bacterium]
MADEAENEKAEVKQKKSLSTMTIVILAVVLASMISGGVVGLTIFLLADDSQQPAASANANDAGTDEEEDGAGEEEDKGPPIYHRLDPKFVVTFRDQRNARFMQFTVQIMTRDENVISQIKEHNPAIRSNLLLLFNNKTSELMSSREGKEQLLREIAEDINASLEELADTSGVEAAYFESFLIQ